MARPAAPARAASVEDAFATATRLASEAESLARRVRQTPGLLDGSLHRLIRTFDKLLDERAERTHAQHRALLRGLDELAADVASQHREKRLSDKHAKLMDFALLRARKRDFYAARKTLRKFDDAVAEWTELNGAVEAYRKARRDLEARRQALREERGRLASLPKPGLGPEEVEHAQREFEGTQTAVARFLSESLSTAPCSTALPTWLAAAREPGTGVPPPDNATSAQEMVLLLGHDAKVREVFGVRSVRSLFEATDFSEKKIGHLLGGESRWPAVLRANRGWLAVLAVADRTMARMAWEDEPPDLLPRVASLRAFLEKLPGSADVVASLRALGEFVVSGRFAAAQESARLYRTHGESARRLWAGTLDARIKEIDGDVAGLTRQLDQLPPPETLLEARA